MARRPPHILVTGASQGIGAAIATVFARETGGRISLVARQVGKLRQIARLCRAAGAEAAEAFRCDVSDARAVREMARQVLGRMGEVDVVVNNAGSFLPEPLTKMSVAGFDAMLGANLRSAFLVTREFAPAMAKRRRGDIFFMASIASIRGFPRGGAYVAAKHGVLGLARAFRAELKPRGVRVMTILPGATWSPSWEGSGVPSERMMSTEDVAQAFYDAYRLSRRTVVEEIILRPQLGDVE
jgi:NAD(P)-dependent dehydrogenase (short-subunit alcohol dehydrogenase family)